MPLSLLFVKGLGSLKSRLLKMGIPRISLGLDEDGSRNHGADRPGSQLLGSGLVVSVQGLGFRV